MVGEAQRTCTTPYLAVSLLCILSGRAQISHFQFVPGRGSLRGDVVRRWVLPPCDVIVSQEKEGGSARRRAFYVSRGFAVQPFCPVNRKTDEQRDSGHAVDARGTVMQAGRRPMQRWMDGWLGG